MDDNFLLTDEFIAFSSKIKTIYENKKIKKAELKSFYDKTQAEIKALDNQAKSVEDEFNKWKASQKGTVKTDE
jgi:prefoldin subunit 5